ncbi:helix-turn-helix domain-containing protein [Halosolutus amylolyticus]|uniref:Helix-turn-helix domain-containing protein n=1 Tax=Halosolutus amylolyticus TaxID=2932267 RepID=A0ABD5PNE1_9EURY|nr:helix-turn-helix domain-containing protein [Halosolutus amylolyticus]
MHEVTFRLSGTGGFAAITDEFDATIALWCNDHADLLRVRGSPDDVDRICDRVDEIAGVDDALVAGDRAVVVTTDCVRGTDEPTVDAHLADSGCVLLPPLRYEAGTRCCRVLALSADRLTALYRSLQDAFDVTVAEKRALDPDVDGVAAESPLGLDRVLPSLTKRQQQVFTLAVERGYYQSPRETSMAAIAETVGIDRRTAEDHRRRAEAKLFDAVVAYYRRD